MLVVLLIMGLFVGLVSAQMRPSERERLQVEAGRLAQVLDLAAEEARMTGKSIAWTGDARGYRFSRLGADNEWSEVRDSDLLRARSLPQGMSLSRLRIETTESQGVMRVEIPPGGMTVAFSVELALGAESCAVSASPIGEVQVSACRGSSYGAMAPQ